MVRVSGWSPWRAGALYFPFWAKSSRIQPLELQSTGNLITGSGEYVYSEGKLEWESWWEGNERVRRGEDEEKKGKANWVYLTEPWEMGQGVSESENTW